MAVCKIKQESIKQLRDEWKEFYDKCISTSKHELEKGLRNIENEAENDLYAERYSEESIYDWLENSKHELNSAMDDVIYKLNNEYKEGIDLINVLAHKQFSEKDVGKLFDVDFSQFVLVDSSNNEVVCKVRVIGARWILNTPHDGTIEIEFDPSSLEFTSWEDQKEFCR